MTRFVPGGDPRYRHQRAALRRIIETRGVTALLMEPGTGKTAVVIDYASLLALKLPEGEARVLVVAPLAAVDTWVSQATRFVSPHVALWAEVPGGSIRQRVDALSTRGPRGIGRRRSIKPERGQRAERAWGHRRSLALHTDAEPPLGPDALSKPRIVLEVLNLDVLSSRRAIGSRTMADYVLAAVQHFDPHLVVVDESHRIKGASSNTSALAGRIGATVPRRLILTGTVMPLGPMDVWAQWRFLNPGAFHDHKGKPLAFGEFEERYAELGGHRGREVVGFKRLPELERVMARNAIVVRKEDALDLPPTTDVVVPVRLSDAQARTYEDMKKRLRADFHTGRVLVGNRLTQTVRLRQITAGHLPDDAGTVHAVGSAKVDTIRSLVQDTLVGEKRVVIFAYFTHEITDLVNALSTRGTTVERIDGNTDGQHRLAIRQRFGDLAGHPERIVLVAQVRTVSLAVNEFVTASHAIFASLPLQRDDIVQARDRLNRIGQQRPVTYWWALAPGTVDEVIYRAYLTRTSIEDAVLDHVEDLHAAETDGEATG